MITVTEDKTPNRLPGEYAPMITAEVAGRLNGAPSSAWTLYVDAMAKPSGWQMTGRQRASQLGLTEYAYREGIRWLIKAGLYVVNRVRDAMGRFSTWCHFLASPTPALWGTPPPDEGGGGASPQVPPEAGLPEGGVSPRIPRLRERRKRGGLIARAERPAHLPENCRREAEGQPCRQCGRTRAERAKGEIATGATNLTPRYVRHLTVAEMLGETGTECEHGHQPNRCGNCRARAASL